MPPDAEPSDRPTRVKGSPAGGGSDVPWRESEERNRILTETMLQGVVHQSASGEIIAINPAAERILGKTKAQMIGSTSETHQRDTIREDGAMFAAKDHPSVVALETGVPVRGVTMGVYNPVMAEYRWIRVDAIPLIRPGETRPSAVYAVFDDVTELRRAEVHLRREKELSEMLNRISRVLHSSLDRDEIALRLLAKGVAALGSDSGAVSLRCPDGWKVIQAQGLPPEIVGQLMDDNQERHTVLAAQTKQVVAVSDTATDPRVDREHMARHQIRSVLVAPLIARDTAFGAIFFNFRTKAHAFTASETNFAAQLAASAAIAMENARLLEERRQAEEQFRLIADAAPALMWMAGADNRCTYTNKGWREFVGRADAEELGDGWLENVHPDDLARCQESFAAAVKGGRSFEVEYRLRHHQGEYRWIVDRGVPRLGPDGAFLGYIGCGVDIHDQKVALAAAAAASASKDRFIGVLSHELRTPLTPVLLTAASLAADESVPAPLREQLKMIERNVSLEARLIDDLLDITRIGKGKLEMRPTRCDLHALIALVVAMVADEARQAGVRIEVNSGAGPHQLWGDPARLQQVIWNLLRNAVKFSPSGATVNVATRMRTPAGRTDGAEIEVEVSDGGAGFDPADAERIFEPFEQTTSGTRAGGLGLGLAIARAVAVMHGGNIRAASAGVGQGATFVFCLPGVQAVPERSVSTPGSSRSPVEGRVTRRLLLVEDHGPTLQVLERLLRGKGHEVCAARNVADARAKAAQHRFDLVVSDLGLPDGNGFELMQELRTQYALRGIALSGFGTDEDVQHSQRAGFVAHLTKPVAIEDLLAAIERVTAG